VRPSGGVGCCNIDGDDDGEFPVALQNETLTKGAVQYGTWDEWFFTTKKQTKER